MWGEHASVASYVLSVAAGQDRCPDQYSGRCFSSIWILMQPCLTGYDFDTVPSLQPFNISSRDSSLLIGSLAGSSWLADSRGRQEDACACTWECTAALNMLTGLPHMPLCDDKCVGLVQFPLTASASPLAVHVRINFCLMASPCNGFPAARSLSDIRWLCAGGDWQANKTKPSLASLFVNLCDYRMTGGISRQRKRRRCCREVTSARLSYDMMQRKGRLRILFTVYHKETLFLHKLLSFSDRIQFILVLMFSHYHRMSFNNL